MSDAENNQAILTATDIAQRPARERLGLVIEAGNATSALQKIRTAEEAGVRQIWMTQGAGHTDTLTLFAAAALQTTHVRFGTAIVPTYPRHPLVIAAQALTLSELAPGRLRLGVGPSHRPIIEKAYGLPMPAPLAHLQEYVAVVRDALWEGTVDFHGTYFNVVASPQRPTQIPLLISALGPKAFQVAGEISDGAISWLCPTPYLLQQALPALQTGAKARQRPAPPLVAHVQVAMSSNQQAVLSIGTKRVANYIRLPFYTNMFAQAGFPVSADGSGVAELVQELVIAGDPQSVEKRLAALLASGLDELLITLVPIEDEESERQQLAQLIGSL